MFRRKKDDKVEEEILSMVEEGSEQGLIHANEAEMISNIFDFDDKKVRDIMTSRNKIFALEQTEIIKDVLEKCLESGYSRYPVYDEDIDQITGVVHLKDMVTAYLHRCEEPVSAIVEETIFVHPTMSLSKLLKKMQKEKIHLAVVLDEYGQTDGLVTLEDIIEEIVGNIMDEHDTEETEVHASGKDGYVVDASMQLNDLEELIPDLEFPESDIETLNGFLLYKLGHLPRENENISIDYGGYIFHPLLVRDKMIKSVKIKKSETSVESEE